MVMKIPHRALIALALFIVLAVLPVTAISANPATGLFNGSVILKGPLVPTVFIGEDHLNLTPVFGVIGAGGDYTIPAGTALKIGWWSPGSVSFPANPSQIFDVSTRYRNFYVGPMDFGAYTGTWYSLTTTNSAINPAFIVADPVQAVAVINPRANNGMGQDMTGRSVVRGTLLTIKVDTNLAAFTAGGRSNDITGYLATYGPIDTTKPVGVNDIPNAATDGFITIKVKDETGQVFTSLYTNSAGSASVKLPDKWVNTQPWYLGTFTGNNGAAATGWVTDALNAGTGMPAYPAGTYTVWSESTLSRMKDNYKLNGADYGGKTISLTGTVTLVSGTTGTVSRSLPATAAPGATITVTLTPGATLVTSPGWGVTETLPAGWTFVSTTAFSDMIVAGAHNLAQLGAAPITYTVTAPAAAGVYTFGGTFTDGNGATGNVGGATSVTVGTVVSPVQRYDTNGTPGIQKDEMITAINDFLFNNTLSKADAVAVLNSFLFS